MWTELYKIKCLISDYENITSYGINYMIRLHRIEYDANGKMFIIFKYSDNTNYGFFYTELDKKLLLVPLFNEYYNTMNNDIDSRLVDILFKLEINEVMLITININSVVIPLFLNTQINTSCINTICTILMLGKKDLCSKEISDLLISNNFIPEDQTKHKMFKKKDFKIKLFDYQKNSIVRMANIENTNTSYSIPRTFELEIGDVSIIWDPFYNKVVDSHKYCTVMTNGGILSDSMGLGKTLTMIGLTYYNNRTTSIVSNDFMTTNATLVIVPSHLAKQWADEYKKALPPSHKIITILTKKQHDITTYKDFMEANIIIVTQQFLMNFNNYIEINYRKVTPVSYNPVDRMYRIKEVLQNWKDTNMDIDSMTKPLFEFFHYQRVIIDEGHEIFEKNLRSSISVNQWLLTFINDLKSSYKWYVSGTPFVHGFINCMDYINMKFKFDDEIIRMSRIIKGCHMIHDNSQFNRHRKIGANISNFILSEDFMTNLLKCIVIRHKKEDVESMIQIPSYVEMTEWIELTETERYIYNSKKQTSSRLTLQQLCCHPLIVESMKKIVGINNNVVDLDQVQTMIIDFHKKQVVDYTIKINHIDKTNQAYHMILSNYNSKISESNFMLKALEKISTPDINKEDNTSDITCVICYDIIDNSTNTMITPCGHIYCEDCIMTSIKYKSECPTCKTKLFTTSSEIANKLIRIDRSKKDVVLQNTNPLINKYGAKLGKLIQMIRQIIMMNNTNRIIVFSQWDDMLTLIGKSLGENGINNVFIKGNVHCRNKAITSFKEINQKEETRVIMLSLKNSASGTNLTEATHIFFIEPISLSRDECKMIEGQAIGRACRIGQKNIVQIIRILCKNTVEEEIYNTSYNYNTSAESNNIVV